MLTQDRAKIIAKTIYAKYTDNSKTVLSLHNTSKLMSDGANNLQKKPALTQKNIALFMKILDKDQDGKVSLQDFQNYAIKVLTNKKNPQLKIYTSMVRKRLQVAYRLFKHFDKNNTNTLTSDQIPSIIRQTYKQMGIAYEPTAEDIEAWMKMTDLNNDGLVQYYEFEAMIIRSLQHVGIQIYK